MVDAGTVSSWVAAAVSAFSLLGTLWVRRHDRPEAEFIKGSLSMPSFSKEQQSDIREFTDGLDYRDSRPLAVTNVGDAAGHQVTFDGKGIKQAIPLTPNPRDEHAPYPWRVLARADPGDTLFVLLWLDGSVPEADVELHIRWRRTPTRHRRAAETWVPITGFPSQGRLPVIRRRHHRGAQSGPRWKLRAPLWRTSRSG